ncbi:MAG: iron ABC transporter permease [Candidatus Omnitrophica bacterium]|nr:iron ABC transporter permease [Candidatus Omnitrophota bacterium]
MSERNKKSVIIALLIASIAALFVVPLLGISDIPIKVLLERSVEDKNYSIYWNIRLPRALLAFMVGAILSLCGMVYQAIFRNPLTTPFTLGISSGAAFGAVAFIIFGSEIAFLGLAKTYLSAFLGAILSVLLLYLLMRIKGGFSTFIMLLAGVAINFIFSSLILFLQYIADYTKVFHTYRWLMGNLGTYGFEKTATLFPFFIIGSFVILVFNKELNLMLLGEDLAVSRGLDTDRFKLFMFLLCSVMVGASVSLCGIIGFVGMVAPHISRLIIGSNHRYLAPASLLFGGCFMVICDLISRKIVPPSEIPIGIITALLGGPLFIWLLIRRGSNMMSF